MLLKSEDGLTWLGGFSGERDYESLSNWAYEYSINVVKPRLPQGLKKLEFEWEEDSD